MAKDSYTSDRQIVTRKFAIANGLARYFPGTPCPKGHIEERYTSGGTCSVCAREKLEIRRRKNGIKEKTKQDRNIFLEKRRKLNIDWKKKNRERLATEAREYYLKNKEKCDRKNRERAKLFPDGFRIRNSNRRALKTKAEGKHTSDDIKFLLNSQKFKCAACFVDVTGSYHVDHIMPLSRNGRNDRSNLQILCAPCNHSKHALDPFEWAQRNGRLL